MTMAMPVSKARTACPHMHAAAGRMLHGAHQGGACAAKGTAQHRTAVIFLELSATSAGTPGWSYRDVEASVRGGEALSEQVALLQNQVLEMLPHCFFGNE